MPGADSVTTPRSASCEIVGLVIELVLLLFLLLLFARFVVDWVQVFAR